MCLTRQTVCRRRRATPGLSGFTESPGDAATEGGGGAGAAAGRERGRRRGRGGVSPDRGAAARPELMTSAGRH